jgi:hypothetical protein
MPRTNLISHRQNPKHQTAIAFIHGYSGDPEKTWGKFPKLLKTEKQLNDWDIYSLGYPTSFLPDIVGIWKAQPDLETVAHSLVTTTNLTFDRYKSIAWVAHSMGGLALQRALVDNEQFARKAGYVFLFGTPSNGLIKASFVKFWKPSLRDMSKGGNFIVDLRNRWSQKYVNHPAPFELFVTAGDQDEFVPRQTSLGPFLASQHECCSVIPGDHLSIVKPIDSDHLGFQLIIQSLTKKASGIIQANAARIALEKQQFQQTITQLEPNKHDLSEKGLVRLALAYEGVGRHTEAFELLKSEYEKLLTDQTEEVALDALGVFAGRLKRRWIEKELKTDAELACQLYGNGFRMSYTHFWCMT